MPAAEAFTGMQFSCVRDVSMHVLCFGDLENGGYRLPASLLGISAIACGYDFLIAVNLVGFAMGFGNNDFGTLAVPAAQLSAITAGWNHACGTYAATGG